MKNIISLHGYWVFDYSALKSARKRNLSPAKTGAYIGSSKDDRCYAKSASAGIVFFMLIVLLAIFRLPAKAQTAMWSAIEMGQFSGCSGSGDYNDMQYDVGMATDKNEIWYRFELVSRGKVSVSLCGSTFDTQLNLMDNYGSVIYSNDDNGPLCSGAQSSLREELDAGVYYLQCLPYSDHSGDLSVEFSVGRPSTLTDGKQQPVDLGERPIDGSSYQTVTANGCYLNTIGNPSGDVYYKFSLSATARVALSTCGSPLSTTIRLLSSNYEELSVNQSNGAVCSGSTGSLEQVLTAGTYYVVTEGQGSEQGDIIFSITASVGSTGPSCAALGVAPSANKNYTVSYHFDAPFDNIILAKERGICESQASVVYYDGLGRAEQQISVKGSGNGEKDIVTVLHYDGLGRQSRQYLPYASSTGDGGYKSDALSSSGGLYGYYQGSTLSSQGIASTAYPYGTTDFGGSSLSRPYEQGFAGQSYQHSGSGVTGSGHTQRTVYEVNTLDGECSARKFYSTAETSGSLVHRLSSPGNYEAGTLRITVSYDENWVSGRSGRVEEYRNESGQMVMRRVWSSEQTSQSTYYVYDMSGDLRFVLPPGCNPDQGVPVQELQEKFCYQYRYDERHRLVEKRIPGADDWEWMVYDNQDQLVLSQDSRLRTQGLWHYNKYNAFGELVMKGIYISNQSRASLEQQVGAMAFTWENYQGGTENYGYSNRTFPLDNLANEQVLYYGQYTFPGANTTGITANSNYGQGRVTGSNIGVFGGLTRLINLYYYDQEGRVVFERKGNHLSGNDDIEYSYSFGGRELSRKRRHSSSNGNVEILTERSYDHMGRELKLWKTIAGNRVLLSERTYNDLGQLHAKSMHNGKQRTGYSYHVRGWLKTIHSAEFSEELKYEDGSVPQYNGNISNQLWGSGSNLSRSFTYRYDFQNRLVSAESAGLGEQVSYDGMGNILSLTREGYGTNRYTYDGNRLSSISGFVNGSYTYDPNGNMTSGPDGLSIRYNSLYLPALVAKNGQSAVYIYDLTGRKVKRQGGGEADRDYIDEIEYQGGVIDLIRTEEGVARRSGNSYNYEYDLKDHLGNTRYSFDSWNGDVRRLQEQDYYAFGLSKPVYLYGTKNKYLYNGKELQEFLGQYDYGARFYDPVIARWNSIDPLAEKFFDLSPYNYTDNNPVNNIDPDGMDIIYGANSTTFTGADAMAAFSVLKNSQQGNNGGGDDDDKKKKEKPKSEQIVDGLLAGLKDLANALAPVRPANEDDPESLSEWWEGIKNAPSNISDTYSNGSLEDQTRLTASFFGLLKGKKPTVSGVAMAGMKGGSRLLYFGKIAVDRDAFHRTIKPKILKSAGSFSSKVGSNPDIKVVGGQIHLTGTGPFKGKSFPTNLNASEYLKP